MVAASGLPASLASPRVGRDTSLRIMNPASDGQGGSADGDPADNVTPAYSGPAGLGQVALTVRDVTAAVAFYREVLGLRFLFSAGPALAFLRVGDVRLMITTPQGHGEPGKNSVLYYRVDDLEVAWATVTARGARAEREPALVAKLPDHDLWMAFVRDPEGNLVGLMHEVRPPAPPEAA